MTENYSVLSGANSFFYKGNQTGLLICHGFGGTPQSVRAIGDYMAAVGFTVYGLRLKGHGTHFEDMERSTYQDWIKSIEEAYLFLKEQTSEIFVIGQSMGGALSLQLAAKYPEIKGVVFINAAITSIPSMEVYQDKLVPRYLDEEKPDIKDDKAIEITYNKVPIRSVNQLLRLMKETRKVLTKVYCPILAFQSIDDHVVPPENTEYIIDHVRSEHKSIIPLLNSYHVASLDYEKEFIADTCCKFIMDAQVIRNKELS